jgi:hypothetical protein
MAPDLFSFGPLYLTHLPMMIDRWRRRIEGHPLPRPVIPAYVHHAYNVTHSLVIWVVLMALALYFFKRKGWVMGAWGLYILCDIPLHSTRFFPTPYLWPLSTPFVNGASWANASFMLWNYGCILATYLLIWLYA